MGESYPELLTDQARIEAVAAQEEESFLATLRTGSALFERVVDDVEGVRHVDCSRRPGFRAARHLRVPDRPHARDGARAGPRRRRGRLPPAHAGAARQRRRPTPRRKKTGHVDVGVYRSLLDASGATTFTGYVEVSSEATLRGLLVGGIAVDVGDRRRRGRGRARPHAVLRGVRWPARRPRPHHARRRRRRRGLRRAEAARRPRRPPRPGRQRRARRRHAPRVATVESARRKAVSRAHTATHLVHQAIRRALGDQAAQAGSLNDAGRFRFDFSSPTARAGGRARRRRVGGQRDPARRPAGAGVRHDAGRGPSHRRDRAVR